MKILSDLYKKIRTVNFNKNQFTEDDSKMKVLFIDPAMSSFDWYTCLLPYIGLPETNVITAATKIYRESELDKKEDTVLTRQEILWADVIVFPWSLEKLSGSDSEDRPMIFQDLRKINPAIKIIFTVEFDFYSITKDHYLLKGRPKLKNDIISRLDENCAGADRLIVLNEKLAKKLTEMGFEDVRTLPLLFDKDTITENVDYKDTLGVKNALKMFVLSVDLNEYNYSNLKDFIPVFEKIKKKHKDNFKLVFIGDDPKQHYPKFNMVYTHLKRGSIVHKYKSILKSSADCHLVLNKKTTYYQNSDIIADYMERGVFDIPIISMNTHPFNEIISNNKNGFLLNRRMDLLKIVDNNIDDKTNLCTIYANIKQDLSESHQIDMEQLSYVEHQFVSFEEKSPSTDENIEEY